MLSHRLLLRAAQRLHQVWGSRAVRLTNDLTPLLERLGEHQRLLHQAQQLLSKARRHGLSLVVPRLEADLLGRVKAAQEAAGQVRQVLERPSPLVPDLGGLVADLRQLEAEFGGVQIDWQGQSIAVTTEPITLEDVDLGPFAIRFFWQRLVEHADVQCFDVVALDPNPAASNERVTHPHVKDETLCAGDATAPLHRALEQGRLADAFFLIRSVLTHYNGGSPYVPLEDWRGITCEDCGRTVDEDDRCSCDSCDLDYCTECMTSCATCDHSRCGRCLTRCAVCEEYCCAGCLQACAHSVRDCCPGCLQSCPACGADVARDELDEESGLCPSCQQPRNDSLSPPDLPNPIPVSAPLEKNHADSLAHISSAAG